MAFYDKFPYTNFQELNLDWLTQEVSKVRDNRDASDASAAAALASEQAAKASETEAAASARASAESATSAAGSEAASAEYLEQIGTHTAGAVADWLKDNITPTTPAVDASLTISGAAADAKKTGDAINDLKSGLMIDVNSQALWQSGGITISNGATSSTNTRIRTRTYIDQSVRYVGCAPGWKFGIFAYNRDDDSYVGEWNGSAFQTSDLTWLTGFVFIGRLQESYKIKIVASTANNDNIDSSYYSNAYLYHTTDETFMHPGFPADAVKTIEKINSVENRTLITDSFDSQWATGYIDTSPEVGGIVDLYVNTNTQYKYLIIDCVEGDVFTITAKGGNASRAWAFVDDNNAILSHSNVNIECVGLTLTAPANGKFIVNGVVSYASGYSVTRTRYLSEINQIIENKTDAFSKGIIVPESMPDCRIAVNNLTHDVTSDLSLSDLYDAYDDLVTLYPTYITKTDLGTDASNTYHIYRYDFSPEIPTIESEASTSTNRFNDYTASDYPVFIMDACIHGGEKPCAVALLNLMDKIAKATDDNGILGWLRSNIHFVIVPMVNPWGYVNNLRYNSNHVDLNRNFPPYWKFGDPSASSDRYRGASALSESESKYINAILNAYKNKAVGYLSWHTFGSFTSYARMSCFMVAIDYMPDKLQLAGIDVIKSVTKSGWKNHNLPTNSGLIGVIQLSSIAQYGMSSNQGAYLGIPSGSPECMYRFYDGQTGADYSTDVNCLNVEYMLYSVCAVLCQTLN